MLVITRGYVWLYDIGWLSDLYLNMIYNSIGMHDIIYVKYTYVCIYIYTNYLYTAIVTVWLYEYMEIQIKLQ